MVLLGGMAFQATTVLAGAQAINVVPWGRSPLHLPDNYRAILDVARTLRDQLSLLIARSPWHPCVRSPLGGDHPCSQVFLLNTPPKGTTVYLQLGDMLAQLNTWIRAARSDFMRDVLSLMYRSASLVYHGQRHEQHYLATMHRFSTHEMETQDPLAPCRPYYKLQWSIEDDMRHSQSLRCYFGYGLGTIMGLSTWHDMSVRWLNSQQGVWIDHTPAQLGFGIVGALLLHRDASQLIKMGEEHGFANGYVPIPEAYLIKEPDQLAISEKPVGRA